MALLLFWLLTGASVPAADLSSLPEHEIKALYLFNFTKYVDWPENAFADSNSCYTIGIAGSEEIFNDLDKLTNGRSVNGRKLRIQHIEKAEDARKCQIVYLGRGSEKLVGTVLEVVRHRPVLTVGEHENFLAQGGMVHFAREENKVRMEIYLDASQEAHLIISARLLPIAKIIRGRDARKTN